MDWLYPAGQGQQCQQQRLSEGRALRPHGDSVNGVAIVDHAGDWAKTKIGIYDAKPTMPSKVADLVRR